MIDSQLPTSARQKAAAAARRKGAGAARSAARLLALQALYQLHITNAQVDQVIEEFLRHRVAEEIDGLRLGDIDRTLFRELVRGTSENREDLDDMLAAVLDEDWPVERLETLLLLLLRAGTYELTSLPAVPAKVIISEYLDLAHAFFGGKEPAMVNGVLDRIARHLRVEEFPREPPPAV